MAVYNSTIVIGRGAKLPAYNRTKIRAQIRHSLRSEYDTNQHSNPNIDPSRTKDNFLIVGSPEGLHRAGVDAIAEAEAYFDYQVEQAAQSYRAKYGKAMRRDTIAGRYGVIEIDPRYWCEGEADVGEFAVTALGFLKEHFGEENIIFAALHMDETNPHMQFAITVRDYEIDGCFRQQKWFAGAKSYVSLVDACRDYYIEHSNIPTDHSRSKKESDGYSPAEYTQKVQEAKAKADAEIANYVEQEYKPKMKKICEELAREEIEKETVRHVDESEVVRLAAERARRIREEAEEERDTARFYRAEQIRYADLARKEYERVRKNGNKLEVLIEKIKLPLEAKANIRRMVADASVPPSFQSDGREVEGELSL